MASRDAMADDEAANIRNPRKHISKDENRIPLMQAIDQQTERTGQAKPPKSVRNNDPLVLFRRPPLDEEAREEHDVAQPANDFPNAPFDAEEFVIGP